MVAVPSSVLIVDGSYARDGGSIRLELLGPDGAKHSLHVPEHLFSNDRFAGALILDGEVLAVRGADEAALVQALRFATYAEPPSPTGADRPASKEVFHYASDDLRQVVEALQGEPGEGLKYLVRMVLNYVESPEYVEVARRLGRHNS